MTSTAELSGGERGMERPSRVGSLSRVTAAAALLWSCGDSASRATCVTPSPQRPGLVAHFSSLTSIVPCGLTVTGAAYCWILGAPVREAKGFTFTAITSAWRHMRGLVAGGTSYFWGCNQTGQLGNGIPLSPNPAPTAVSGRLAFDSVSPQPVGGGLTFRSISAGLRTHTCGLTGHCFGGLLQGRQ